MIICSIDISIYICANILKLIIMKRSEMAKKYEILKFWVNIMIKEHDKFWLDAFYDNNYHDKKEKDYLTSICFACGTTGCQTERSHIKPLNKGGNNNIENLHLLCKECHLECEFLTDYNIDYYKWFDFKNQANSASNLRRLNLTKCMHENTLDAEYYFIKNNEYEFIRNRTKQALTEKKKQGVKLGTPANFTKEGREKGIVARKIKAATNENTTRARNYAKLLRDEGLTLQEIANRLNNEGHLTATGKQYQRVSVKRILT